LSYERRHCSLPPLASWLRRFACPCLVHSVIKHLILRSQYAKNRLSHWVREIDPSGLGGRLKSIGRVVGGDPAGEKMQGVVTG